MTKMKVKLGGFKKSEVDEHLKQIQGAQEGELEELTNKIEACHRERDLLGQELSVLTDQDTNFTSVIILELALNKVERVAGYINKTAEEDVLAIQESSRQKLLALEDVISRLDKDIQDAKKEIENELKNITELANGEERKKSTALGNKGARDNVNFGKVYPIADWLKYNKSEQLNKEINKESEFWGEQLEDQSRELAEQMTADGTTEVPLRETDKLGNNSIDTSAEQPEQDCDPIANKSTDDLGEERLLRQDPPLEASVIEAECEVPLPIAEMGVSRLDEVDQTDFWDSCSDGEEESDSSLQEIAVTEDTEAKPIVSDSPVSQEHDLEDKVEDFFNNEENPEELASDHVSNGDQSGEQSGETKGSEQLQSQAGVRQEIENVRHKYVIGKIAGEDLLDDSGRLIIRKSAKITESVVEIAQREGKLADLIIHMILPGQEE